MDISRGPVFHKRLLGKDLTRHKHPKLFFSSFFEICSLFSRTHSFEVTVHYGPRNACHIVLYTMMHAPYMVFVQWHALWGRAFRDS